MSAVQTFITIIGLVAFTACGTGDAANEGIKPQVKTRVQPYGISLSDLQQYPGYKHIGAHRLIPGLTQIPSQTSKELSDQDQAWSCGPNSAARAMLLLGHSVPDYLQFVRKCPKTFDHTSVGKVLHHSTDYQPGQSQSLWDAFARTWKDATRIAANVVDELGASVGPNPETLADYIKTHGVDAHAHKYQTFDETLSAIKTDIDAHKPVIALLVFSQFNMHYVVIVGYNDENQKIVVLNTTGHLLLWTSEEFNYLLNADGFYFTNSYNLIRF